MTREQKLLKGIILADLRIVIEHYNDPDKGIDIDIPKIIRDKEKMITGWEADCRYYPIKGARKDSVKKIYDAEVQWLEEGKTRTDRKKNRE